jgi:hypothetical protein
MPKKDVLTKILAIIGALLACLPVLAPILFSVATIATRLVFRFDYLMPAELFPLALIGGGLLTWAALRARSRLKLVALALGIALVFLVGSQALAVVTGLASGETEPVGLPWIMTLAMIGVYTLAVIAIGVGGILLLRDIFRQKI